MGPRSWEAGSGAGRKAGELELGVVVGMDRQGALYLSLLSVWQVSAYPSAPPEGWGPLKAFLIFLSIIRLPHWFLTHIGDTVQGAEGSEVNKTHKSAAPGPPMARRGARLQGNVGAGSRQRREGLEVK